MNIDFTPNTVPHSLKEAGGVDSGQWQLTLHPHNGPEVVLPTIGKMVQVYDDAAIYLSKHMPGKVLK